MSAARPSSWRLAPIAAAALLAGCASMAPPHERPAAPVADTFPLAPAGEAGTAAADLPWRSVFTEPRLQRLIEAALLHNRDLRVAAANIEAARAQLGVRRSEQLPTVGAGLTATRQSGRDDLYTAGVQVSAFEIDLFGRLRSLSDAAAAQLAASVEARRAAQITLVASVASLHHAVLSDEVLIGLTRRTLDSRLETLRLVQLRFDNGVASEIDLRLAQTTVENARAALAQAERQRQLDRNALELLVGQPLAAVEAGAPAAAAWNPQAVPDVPAGLPAEVLLRRPDVLQAEAQLRAANANIGAARAAFWPRITLTGSVGGASTELSGLFSNGLAWSFAPQLLQPLFDAGRNRAALGLSQAQRDAAVAQYERTVQAAFRDVADALAGRATLGEQLAAVLRQRDAEAARLRLVQLRFDNGIASSLELLDAQRSLFVAEQQRVQTELALAQNRIATYRALGGGLAE